MHEQRSVGPVVDRAPVQEVQATRQRLQNQVERVSGHDSARRPPTWKVKRVVTLAVGNPLRLALHPHAHDGRPHAQQRRYLDQRRGERA